MSVFFFLKWSFFTVNHKTMGNDWGDDGIGFRFIWNVTMISWLLLRGWEKTPHLDNWNGRALWQHFLTKTHMSFGPFCIIPHPFGKITFENSEAHSTLRTVVIPLYCIICRLATFLFSQTTNLTLTPRTGEGAPVCHSWSGGCLLQPLPPSGWTGGPVVVWPLCMRPLMTPPNLHMLSLRGKCKKRKP